MVWGNVTNLFADDMLLFQIIQSAVDFDHIQKGINNIGRWVEANYLTSHYGNFKTQNQSSTAEATHSFGQCGNIRIIFFSA